MFFPSFTPKPLEHLGCEYDEVSTLVKQENKLAEQVMVAACPAPPGNAARSVRRLLMARAVPACSGARGGAPPTRWAGAAAAAAQRLRRLPAGGSHP